MTNNKRVTIEEIRQFLESAQVSMPELSKAMEISTSTLKMTMYNQRPVSAFVTERFYRVQEATYQAVGGVENFDRITKEFDTMQRFIHGDIK